MTYQSYPCRSRWWFRRLSKRSFTFPGRKTRKTSFVTKETDPVSFSSGSPCHAFRMVYVTTSRQMKQNNLTCLLTTRWPYAYCVGSQSRSPRSGVWSDSAVNRVKGLAYPPGGVATVTADHRNFYFINSTLYCQMPPNTRINLIKKIPQNKKEQVFWGISPG